MQQQPLFSASTRRQGAEKGAEHAAGLRQALLDSYRSWGPMTDAEMAAFLGIDRTTVNARRHELMKLGLIDRQPKGTRKNTRTQVQNATWGI